MSITIKIDLKDTLEKLDNMVRNIEKGQDLIEKLSDEMVDFMVTEAMTKVPVDTGDLMSSIHYEGSFPNYQLVADAKNRYTNQSYGQYVEFGTSMQQAQPYMWPAVYSAVNTYLPIIQQQFRIFMMGK